MARLGLGEAWRVSFSNDISPEKSATYARRFGPAGHHTGDVWSIDPETLPGRPVLAWASFPCQDLSLAGARAGLAAPRSGAFWGFWRLMEALAAEARAPRVLALENVTGLLSSRNGADFEALCRALKTAGFRFGALEIDAAHFVPQSRPRVFIVACAGDIPAGLQGDGPAGPLHSAGVRAAHARLERTLAHDFVWWKLPAPPVRNTMLADLLEPDDLVRWRTPAQTDALLAQMAPAHRARVAAEAAKGARSVGAVFRRVRIEDGEKVQRAEVRFDGLAGCLRTPAGGSSRQMLLIVEGEKVRSRLLTAREGARLMGLPDDYPMPASESRALHLVGDGVVAPVVGWLSTHLLEPLARA